MFELQYSTGADSIIRINTYNGDCRIRVAYSILIGPLGVAPYYLLIAMQGRVVGGAL